MKKLIFLALMLISFSSFAQGKFIEVEVTDTVSLKPLNFRIDVYADTDDLLDTVAVAYDEDDNYDPLAEQEKLKNRLQEAKRMVESKKYKVSSLDGSGLSVWERKRAASNGFSFIVNSEPEMKKMREMLDAKQGIMAAVTVAKYSDEADAERALISKIFDKAKKRAIFIGANSELKPGKIVEVREGKNSESSFTDFYTQILKYSKFGQDTTDYKGTLSKTFVIKFAAE
jgi:hypothetical protein